MTLSAQQPQPADARRGTASPAGGTHDGEAPAAAGPRRALRLDGGTPGLNSIPALSIAQPWASLLISGLKTIETRTWRPEKPRFSGKIFRGTFLVCTSKVAKFHIQQLPRELRDRLALAWWGRALTGADELPNGVAVGTIDLVDDRPMTAADEVAACCELYPRAVSWVCANPRRIKPFAVKGALGFYDVPIERPQLEPLR